MNFKILGFDFCLSSQDKQTKKNFGEDNVLERSTSSNSYSHILCISMFVSSINYICSMNIWVIGLCVKTRSGCKT